MAEAKSRRGKTKGRGCLVLFFIPFAGIGCFFMWLFGLRPLLATIEAQGWPTTECVITSSELGVSHGDDGSTYSIEISFRYEVDGRSYESDTFDFRGDFSSSGRDGKQAVISAHPVGSTHTCFYDPDDPATAVIDPEPGLYMLWGLFGLPFALVGFGGMYGMLRKPRLRTRAFSKRAERPTSGSAFRPASIDADEPAAGSSGELKPSSTPGRKLIGMLFFGLVWNGIVGTIVYVALFKDGKDIETMPAIILGIFGLIGAAILLIGVPYQFLAMFNPMPRLRITGGQARIGARLRLEWDTSGRCDRLTQYTIHLIGREVARYRRGTNTYTDTHQFHKAELFEGIDPHDVMSGGCDLVIPTSTAPSFDGGNNKIEWQIEVRGDIPTWPDVKLDFPLQIGPAEGR